MAKLPRSRFSSENFFGGLNVLPVGFMSLMRAGVKVRMSLRKWQCANRNHSLLTLAKWYGSTTRDAALRAPGLR